mgnify:CR=1 FL=1
MTTSAAGSTELENPENVKADALRDAAARLRAIEEWEQDIEVRDRFALLAFGLQRKQAWLRKRAILNTVFELKRRLRVVLYRFQEKREERNFNELSDLILTFDQKPGY